MIDKKYLEKIKEEVEKIGKDKSRKFFIFGSSLEREKFGDVDLGVKGKISNDEVLRLKERFEESTLPFKVDVIKINDTDKKFRENVLNNKILWIKH